VVLMIDGERWSVCLRPCPSHALFDKVKGEVQKSAHTFLHDRHKTPLVLPMVGGLSVQVLSIQAVCTS
jgi:hypothetical protein